VVTQQRSSYDLALEISEGGGDFELPDEGSYIIEFRGVIDKREFPNDKDPDGPPDVSLTLQFVIDEDDEDFPGVEFRDYFPQRVTAKNKSGRLWAALLGVKPEELAERGIPRTSEMVGNRCTANLIHRNASNGNTYPKIAGVSPLRRKKARPVVEEDDNDPGF
jgi:hypothetical protein